VRPAAKLIATAEAAEVLVDVAYTAAFPFDVELHDVLRRGDSGFYAYAVMRHPATLPGAVFHQTRFVSKTSAPEELTEFVIGDERVKNINRSEVVRAEPNTTVGPPLHLAQDRMP
jgi:hypothetical protein